MRPRTSQKDRFVWPIVGTLATAAAVMVAALVAAAVGMDASALRHEGDLISTGLGDRAQEINHAPPAQAVWDEAVRHLDNRFDAVWTHANIGTYLFASGGFSGVYVLDRADRPEYAMRDGRDAAPSSWNRVAPLAAPVLAAVRGAESRRLGGAARPWPALLKSPIQSSSFVQDAGRIELLTATLVQPDFGKARLSERRAPVLITVYPFDQAFIAALGHRTLIKGLHLINVGAADPRTGLVISDSQGRPLRALAWTPERPGVAMLERALPPFSLLLALIAFGGFVFHRQANQTAESLIASEAKATHMALHDFLTGLANRRLFSDRLAQAVTQARRAGAHVAVICIDLDRFKEINDTFGHPVGDELVQVVAKRLHDVCRTADTLARLGGDEFAILLPDASVAGVSAICSRISDMFKSPLLLSSGSVHISGSMGISIAAGEDTSGLDLMRQADLALYRAKDLGGAQHCFFEHEMDAALRLRRALENDLRAALAAGELELHYQPQINGAGKMTGVEALVRWTHAERGPMSPSLFVPIAEECGLIGELGLFTLRRAFEDSARWRHLSVAVNVSARQLRLPSFLSEVTALVAETGISPRQFELEITEGLLLDDDAHTLTVLRRLKEMGFTLALDDFGTGYSSLSYLRRYPIDKIKIDRSFVTSLGVDTEAEAVVGAIVRLARALGLHVIAEGVETSEQRDKLMEVGCPEVQGFYFSAPVPGPEIDALTFGSPFTGRGARRHRAESLAVA